MIEQFMRDRRPANWQQWAEVVWRDVRNPKFIGDMPHTWVGSDFIRSALDLFAYGGDCGSEATQISGGDDVLQPDCALTIGAGIQLSWIARGDSVVVRGLRTPQGILNYSVASRDSVVTLHFEGDIPIPAAGVRILLPSTPAPIRLTSIIVDGKSEPVSPTTVTESTGVDGRRIVQKPGNEFILRHQARTVVLTFR